MSSAIFLYKQLNETLSERAKFTISPPKLSYSDVVNEEKTIPLNDTSTYNINELDSVWSPTENELYITQDILIDSPQNLFGQDGLTSFKNKLALSVKIYSRSSNFSENIIIESFDSSSDIVNVSFTEEYFPNSLSGTIYFEYYLIVQEVNETLPFQATQPGMQLSSDPLIAYSISVDGDGSEFPIEEMNEPGKGLWRIWMNWVDIFSDNFDSTNVKIILNSAHPLYDRLYKGGNRLNQYVMNEIVISAIILIIQKAIIVEDNDINENMEAEPSSIAQAIWYWISTFNISTDSLESVANSARSSLDAFSEE